MRAWSPEPGDWVVYQKSKHSNSPGPRAQEVSPATHGDDYGYVVKKFWIVKEILPDDKICLRTRRGKQYVHSVRDPDLRPATWWEKVLYRRRFKEVLRGLQEAPETIDAKPRDEEP